MRDCTPRIPNFGISGLKKMYFSVEFHDICYKLFKNDFFSHTQTVTILSPSATMVQVATALFHSWLTRAYSDFLIWQHWETRLLFGDSVLLLVDCPTNIGGSWKSICRGTTKLRSRLSNNSVNILCFLPSFVFEPLEVQTVVQTIFSLFSGLILLLNGRSLILNW